MLSNNKQEIAKSYFDTIILKDVISRFKIKEQEVLIRLARFYLTSIGSRITFNSIARFLKLPIKTVYNFSIYLEKAYLIFFVKRFSFSIKVKENSPRKVYSIDNVFPCIIGENSIKIKGRLLENVAASTLYLISKNSNDFEFYYWNEYGKEVDFIIKDSGKYRLVQVAYSINDEKTRERGLSSILECANRMNIDRLEIVTMNYDYEEVIAGKKIRYINASEWIKEILKDHGF
ncbi:MAG: hypothetical protein ARM1_0388 [Candidatus Micrarchaeota archaeon]|nr:MAG: hypothetical protein ARM1_0388 [Candidatus Micrarchaeota archaeon]